MARHTNNGACPKCKEIASTAHPILQDFLQSVQKKEPHLHVAWAHRGQKDQEDAYRRGTTQLKWPESKHNKMPSLAIDFFELDNTGKARWDRVWLTDHLAPHVRAAGLVWGGDWKRFKDYPHVEIA